MKRFQAINDKRNPSLTQSPLDWAELSKLNTISDHKDSVKRFSHL